MPAYELIFRVAQRNEFLLINASSNCISEEFVLVPPNPFSVFYLRRNFFSHYHFINAFFRSALHPSPLSRTDLLIILLQIFNPKSSTNPRLLHHIYCARSSFSLWSQSFAFSNSIYSESNSENLNSSRISLLFEFPYNGSN